MIKVSHLTLLNSVTVVAGSSQGVGEAVAKLFAAEGSKVILLARDTAKLQQVAEDISRNGGTAYVKPMDVSKTANWDALVEWMNNENLSCDVLVNNAYWRTYVPIGDVTDEDWDHTLDVTLKSYFLGARAMIPLMLKNGKGSIINISSLQSQRPEPRFGAYAVAKGGVDSLSRVIAKDYGPVIRANTIISGAVDTPGFAEGDEFKQILGKRLPLGRIASADEIAKVALFLASSMSSFITGTEIIPDGGQSIT